MEKKTESPAKSGLNLEILYSFCNFFHIYIYMLGNFVAHSTEHYVIKTDQITLRNRSSKYKAELRNEN